MAVCVNFEIDPVSLEVFLPIMRKNASVSLANEVGCHQFDVSQDRKKLAKIFLYELYDDLEIFGLYKQASHYLEFNQAVSEMINWKSVHLLKRINH